MQRLVRKCPVCGRKRFSQFDDYDICFVCGWEDDTFQERYPNETGANWATLFEAQWAYEHGKTLYDDDRFVRTLREGLRKR